MKSPNYFEKTFLPVAVTTSLLLLILGLFFNKPDPVGAANPLTSHCSTGRCTSTPTPKVTSTPKPTKTATLEPTKTATPSLTPSNTPVPPTKTLSPTPTFTFTPTFTPTATPFPNTILLNEILPDARFKDWNEDTLKDINDQWIELYNFGDAPADISGWSIDTGPDTPVYIIPDQTVIPAKGYLLFFRGATELALEDALKVRLLFPNKTIADDVDLPSMDEFDEVYAREVDGGNPWRTSCVPTPNSRNCQVTQTITSGFNLPYFEENVQIPDKTLNIRVLGTNIFLGILLAIAVGFFSNLVNNAIESHEDRVARLLRPITWIGRFTSRLGNWFNNLMKASRLSWLGFVIKLSAILIIEGFILAFLDPNFILLTGDGIMLVIALGFSVGLIALTDDIATHLYLRLRGHKTHLRVHSGNFLLVIISTFISRLTGFVPGVMLGSPAGIEDIPEEQNGPHLDVIAVIATALVGAGAWWLLPMASYDPWLKTLLVLVFATGVQTVFFEMIPFTYLRGKGIYKMSRVLWVLMFGSITAIFLQSMVNPDGEYLSAFESKNMLLLTLATLAYCLLCVFIWLILTRAEGKAPVQPQPASDD